MSSLIQNALPKQVPSLEAPVVCGEQEPWLPHMQCVAISAVSHPTEAFQSALSFPGWTFPGADQCSALLSAALVSEAFCGPANPALPRQQLLVLQSVALPLSSLSPELDALFAGEGCSSHGPLLATPFRQAGVSSGLLSKRWRLLVAPHLHLQLLLCTALIYSLRSSGLQSEQVKVYLCAGLFFVLLG